MVGKSEQVFHLILISCFPTSLNCDSRLYLLCSFPTTLSLTASYNWKKIQAIKQKQHLYLIHTYAAFSFFLQVSMKRGLLIFTKQILCSGPQLVLQLSFIKLYILFSTDVISVTLYIFFYCFCFSHINKLHSLIFKSKIYFDPTSSFDLLPYCFYFS